jgi:hypothetical protein
MEILVSAKANMGSSMEINQISNGFRNPFFSYTDISALEARVFNYLIQEQSVLFSQ